MELTNNIKKALLVAGFSSFAFSGLIAQQKAKSNKENTVQQKVEIYATGVVKDATTNKPIAAARFSIPDFSAGISDDKGKFKIKVTSYEATLTVSADGYQTKYVALQGQKEVVIYLIDENASSHHDNAQLTFGAKPQTQTTNALASVSINGAWNRPGESPDAYLQGKVAGLSVNMRSGTPNAGGFMLLRGMNSLYTNNQPLIIVDGMLFDYNDYGNSLLNNHYTNALAGIDVRDIDNVTVIKDGTSTYGTKGANGVILITTSRANKLATKIDFAAYVGINFRPKGLPVMEANDYRTYLSDVLKTSGMSDLQIQAHPAFNDNTSNSLYYSHHNNTNWQDQVLSNSVTNNYYLKITGGDNIAKYALTMGYAKNGAVTKKTDATKYNVRFNADLNLSRKLTASTNLTYNYYEQKLKNQGLDYKTNPLLLALIKAPILATNAIDAKGVVSPNLADRDTFNVSNPVAIIENMIGLTKVYRFFGSISLKYAFNKYLSLNTLAGITTDKVREQSFIPAKGVTTDTLTNAIANNRMASQTKRIFSIYNDTYFEYNRLFNRKHQLNARAGLRFLNSSNEQDIVYGYNSATDDFISVGTGVSSLRKVGGGLGDYGWFNTYLSADYSYMNKYFVSANLTADASSRFGKEVPNAVKLNNRSLAIMPSVAVAWLVTSQKFMSHFKQVDVLKLRASYAKTGNDDIGNYTSQQSYVSQNLLGVQGIVRGNVANPQVQWESNTKVNVGVDASFFKERLSISFDMFHNQTANMIVYEPLPSYAGFNYVITNNGSMTTKGVEYSITGRIINKKNLKWDAGFNITANTNRIDNMPASSFVYSYGGASVISQINSPAGLFFGYKTNGVYSTDAEAATAGLTKRQSDASYAPFKGGDVRFVDLNGDKVIDEKDKQIIGNPNPDFVGGFTNRVTYKAFTFEAVCTYAQGNDVYNSVRATLESQSSAYNQLKSVNNRWRTPGQITNMPKAAWGDPMGNNLFSDRWIEDGSFFRIKSLSVSYDLPIKGKKTIKSVAVYAIANNLITFSKYLGYDPESYSAESGLARGIDVGLEPQFKSVTFGIKMGL